MKEIPNLFGQVVPLDPVYLEFLKALNQELLEEPGYVGITPFGSQFKGYALPTSDFDVMLIGTDELVNRVPVVAQRFDRKGHAWEVFSYSYFDANIRTPWSSYDSSIWHFVLPFLGHNSRWDLLISYLRARHTSVKEKNAAYAYKALTYAAYCLTLFETGVLVLFRDGDISETRIRENDPTTRKILDRMDISTHYLGELSRNRARMWVAELQTLAEG